MDCDKPDRAFAEVLHDWSYTPDPTLLTSLVLLALFLRGRTVLDLWLMVTLFAAVPNFLVAVYAGSTRFSVGWYTARGFALIASCMLLSVLVTEMTVLYSRLASALV